MKVYPAIDILGGNTVRLRKGRVNEVRVYPRDPVSIAQFWSGEGANGIHVVDLDGTLDRGNNLETIRSIVRSVNIPVQVGGGIRTEAVAHELIQAGVHALVVGTVAISDKTTFGRILQITGLSRIVVALDYSGNRVLVKGWNQLSDVRIQDALPHLMEQGIHEFLLTCADRDGTLNGPDVETIRSVCKQYEKARIFASGGVRSVEDVRALRDTGAYAVVIGKALLEGAFGVSEAIKAAGE